ncbi:MAG: hypothetical protein V4801_12015 [Burkholderia gladioli]
MDDARFAFPPVPHRQSKALCVSHAFHTTEGIIMSGIKNAFDKIGEGIKDAVEGVGKDIGGAFKMVGGALTANPSLMKSGASDFESGLKQSVDGVAETAAGTADAAMNASPMGKALSAIAGPSAQNFVDGMFKGAAGIVNGGIDGVQQIGDGIAHGNLGEIAKGAGGVAQVATLAVPGLGEAEMGVDAGRLALAGGKGLMAQGATEA